MVRNRKRKSAIGLTDANTMIEAVKSILKGGLSVKSAGIRFNIPRTTLSRYVRKCGDQDINWEYGTGIPRMTPNYSIRQVFTKTEEELLTAYLLKCARLHHGLPPIAARKLAYEFAKANNKAIPEPWNRNNCAGRDWFTNFLKRNKNLSLRTPEATSLARTMGFNKPVLNKFYDNLEAILNKYKLEPQQIYNMDETGLTTVQGLSKIVAPKGCKQIGQVTSAERGVLVTVCCAINALGNSIPPFMIFPRVNFKQHMTSGAPPGTEGCASPSGWITNDIFLKWLEHFVHHTKPTIESRILLIMDNHEAHICLQVIKYAKENNVILLTLPPHTSHKLQPLDRSVYGPLKRYYNDACR